MLSDATRSRLIAALQRKTVRRRASKQVIILSAIGLLLGAGCGYAAARFFTLALIGGSKPLTLLTFAALTPVAMFLAILLHEMGHVMGGISAGMRFFMLAAGPWMLTHERDRYRLRWGNPVGMWGGFASLGPARLDGLRGEMLAMTAGGPLASLVVTALGAWFASMPQPEVLHAFAQVMLIANGGVAMMTLIPSRAGGLVSDGGRLFMLFRGGQAAERWCRLAAVHTQIRGPVRPRDLEPELFDRVWGGEREPVVDEFAFSTLTFYWAFDCGDGERAAQELNFVLDHADEVSPMLEHYLRFEAVFLLACDRAEPIAGASAWVDEKFITMSEEKWRLKAALARLAGDQAGAKAAAEMAIRGIEDQASGVDRWKADVLRELAC